jgi:hypothetical protein
MAHFAKIENGIVTQVIVVSNEHEANGEAYLNSIGLIGTWIQTSYNSNFRGKFAGIGDSYDEETDQFIEPPVADEIIELPVDAIAPIGFPVILL